MLEASAALVAKFGRNVPGAWRAAATFLRVGEPALALYVASEALRRHEESYITCTQMKSNRTDPAVLIMTSNGSDSFNCSKDEDRCSSTFSGDEEEGFAYVVRLLNHWETKVTMIAALPLPLWICFPRIWL
eukprot:tig00000571_g2163.t1